MSELRIDCEAMEEDAREKLSAALSHAAEADLPLVLELLFVSEEEIRRLNERTRGVDKVTDVLSFPAMELCAGEKIVSDEHGECIESAEEDTLFLGSVAVCMKRAEEQAAEYGHSLAREIGYLAVHGALHCLGYDHEKEEDKRVMREKEEEIMRLLSLKRE